MNPERLLLVLRARYRIILACVLFFGALALGLSLMLTKQYTATTRILLDAREPDLLSTQGGSYSVLAPTYIATQVDVLHSDRVADRVIETLGLGKSAQAIQQWQQNREGNATLNQYYAEVLGKFLIVIPSRTSNTLALEFTNPNPEFAAAAANAYAKAYLEVSAQLRADPAKSYADWFTTRAEEERAHLQEAQARLSEFQRTNGIVSNDERLDVETSRLNELNAQLTVIQGQLSESGSREKTAKGRMSSSPDVMHNTVVETLRSEIARSEAKLQDLSKEYGDHHPQYLRAVAELESLKSALSSEMQKVANTVGASNDVNVRREAETREALRQQKEKVLALRAQHDQMTVLQRDVDSAQHAYDMVATRLAQTGIESQVKSTNIVVLEEARVPPKASSPKPARNAAIGLAVGLLAGLSIAVGLERRRPRLRSVGDIAEFLALPVLGVVPRVKIKGKRAGVRRIAGPRVPAPA